MTDGDRPPSPAGATPLARARELVGGARADEGLLDPEASLQRVCRAAAAALAMDGGVIHLGRAGEAGGVVASSEDRSRRVADLAFLTGEGPTLDALRYRRPVLVGDLTHGPRRWPGYTHAAAEVGVQAVLCFPLLIGGITLGVLDLYSERPRTLTDNDLDLAAAFTRVAAHAVLGELPEGRWDGTWEPLIDHRSQVHQAQGMVMVDLGIDLAEALLRMRAHAFSEGIALIDLAEAIIGGLVLPVAEGDQA